MHRIIALVLDLVLVFIFSVIGRASHSEALTLGGMSTTAWPFLVGALVGWAVFLAAKRVPNSFAAGAIVWVSTVVVGMLLRLASGQGVQVAFIIVASVFTALFLLGWRLVALMMRRLDRAGEPGSPSRPSTR